MSGKIEVARSSSHNVPGLSAFPFLSNCKIRFLLQSRFARTEGTSRYGLFTASCVVDDFVFICNASSFTQ